MVNRSLAMSRKFLLIITVLIILFSLACSENKHTLEKPGIEASTTLSYGSEQRNDGHHQGPPSVVDECAFVQAESIAIVYSNAKHVLQPPCINGQKTDKTGHYKMNIDISKHLYGAKIHDTSKLIMLAYDTFYMPKAGEYSLISYITYDDEYYVTNLIPVDVTTNDSTPKMDPKYIYELPSRVDELERLLNDMKSDPLTYCDQNIIDKKLKKQDWITAYQPDPSNDCSPIQSDDGKQTGSNQDARN